MLIKPEGGGTFLTAVEKKKENRRLSLKCGSICVFMFRERAAAIEILKIIILDACWRKDIKNSSESKNRDSLK